MSAEHRYIPATDEDRRQMLAKVGAESLDALFRGIVPAHLLFTGRLDVPPALGEMELLKHLAELAAKNRALDAGPSFLGAGSYDHFVPTVIDHLASRGEFYWGGAASTDCAVGGFELQLSNRKTGMRYKRHLFIVRFLQALHRARHWPNGSALFCGYST